MLDTSKKQWVNWRREAVNGNITKVPYQINGYKASSTNPETWSKYEEVKSVSHNFDGIGIMFDGVTFGIDLDHVLDKGNILDEASRTLINEANTYTEISPSGDGIHLFFKLSEEFIPTSNAYKPNEKIKYECYSQKRYFTVTENIFESRETLRTINGVEALRLLSILGYPWKKVEQLVPTQMQRIGLDEDKILQVMFSAKNGAKAKALWNGDVSGYNNDVSAADLAFCNMLAFYSCKNPDAMERLWMSSPLGSREKTQKRADYRTRTISAAIAYTTDVFTADRSHDKAIEYITKTSKSGEIIILCTENIQIFLESSSQFSGCLRFDSFKQKIEFKNNGVWADLTDADILLIQSSVSKTHPAFGMVSKAMVEDAIHSNAYNHTFDSALEYMKALVWDKTPRLDSWLSNAYSVDNDEYHKSVGSNWLKGLVHRALVPGCKFDYVLVLEGAQGTKKSMSLATLCNPWHVETTMTPENKDFFMIMLGRLVVEFAEGETISRSEVKKLKAIITMQEDVLRLPYARTTSTLKRRCVFAMTTNEEHYLKDDTGNRRWLPVRIGESINVDWIKDNRDQLFAEAIYRVMIQKESTWEFPKDEMEKAQNQRRLVDPQTEIVEEWYANLIPETRDLGINTRQVFNILPGNSKKEEKMTRLDEMTIASILKSALFLKSRRVYSEGILRTKYFPTVKTPPYLPVKTNKEF